MHSKCTLFNTTGQAAAWSLPPVFRMIWMIGLLSSVLSKSDPRTSLGLSQVLPNSFLWTGCCSSQGSLFYFSTRGDSNQVDLGVIKSLRVLRYVFDHWMSMTKTVWLLSVTLVINLILEFCDRSKQSNVYQSWKLYSCVSSMPSKMWWRFW